MMADHTGKKAGRVCSAACFTLLLVLFLAVRFEFYYDLNDDTLIKDILSGAYTGTPNGWCIQILYPLAWFIAFFYGAIPSVPWYGLFLCLCQFGVLFFIAVRLLGITRGAGAGLMALAAEAALAAGLFLHELVIIQYSVTSGVCMAGAVFLFITAPETERASVFFRRNLLPLFLVVLSFMVRTEVCLMLMPFLLLAGISRWCGEKKFFTWANIKKYVTLISAAILCMAAAYSLDLLAYRDSEWSRFRDFFDARTKLYDFYGLPDYDGSRDFYESIGLSRESYALLVNYNFALDESIDAWRLEAIAAYQERQLCNTCGFASKNSVREALWLYKEQILDSFRAVRKVVLREGGGGMTAMTAASMAVMAAYALYTVSCIVPARGRRRAGAILKAVGLILIRGTLWLYLYMVDRVLTRVAMPLLMMELAALAGFMINDWAVKKESYKITHVTYLFCIVCALAVLRGNMAGLQAEYDGRAAADERWNALMDYCRENGDNYYIIDVYSSTSYNGAHYSEKIFRDVDDSFKNFDICGGWAAKSPLARQKLGKFRFKDVQSALCGAKEGNAGRAYFVAGADKDLGWLVQYYGKRGLAVEPVRIDRIRTASGVEAFDVYALSVAAPLP